MTPPPIAISAPPLEPDAIHIWAASLDQPPAVVARLGAVLSADEAARAARFKFELHRARYIVGRGALRCILGAYLRCAPDQVAFSYGLHGKPALALPFAGRVFFNLAHAEAAALYALCASSEIGIDIECDQHLDDAETLAATVFSREECAALTALPPAERGAAFLRGWVRKEAYVKAVGAGMSQPLQHFAVSLDDPARMVRIGEGEHSRTRAAQWSLFDVPPDAGPGYAAALAVRGSGWRLRTMRLRFEPDPGAP